MNKTRSKVTTSGSERKLQKRRRFLSQDVFPHERMYEVQSCSTVGVFQSEAQ